MHAIAQEVKEIANDVKAAVATLEQRKGEKRVWAIIRPVGVTLLVGAATLTVNYLGARRAEKQASVQREAAVEVANQLREFRATHPTQPAWGIPAEVPAPPKVAP